MVIQEQEIAIPQMIGSEKLNTLLIAALKVGADKQDVTFSQISDMAKIGEKNVSRNSKFLVSVGFAETPKARGAFKLSSQGTQYAQALDWGKVEDANKILGQILVNKPLTEKIVGYVDLHHPVPKNDLVGQVALFVGVSKEPRFVTGIHGFLDWLLSSKLIEQGSDGQIIKSGSKIIIPKSLEFTEPSKVLSATQKNPVQPDLKNQRFLPMNITINIDGNTDIEKLKKILEMVKEVSSADVS